MYFFQKEQKYQRLQDRSVDDETEKSDDFPVRSISRANAYFFFASLALFFTSVIVLLTAATRVPGELECAKIVSPYSPLWEAVEFWEGDFDNEFFHRTVFRGPPTPERELAWDSLWRRGIIGVTPEGVKALNKTKAGVHHQIENDGQGVRYGAMVEMFHQLHCLNLIRQFTWLDHYNSSVDVDLKAPDDLVGVDRDVAREHVDHCIETLRLSLMCYGDITPLFFDLDPAEAIGRKADFNVHHKCRRFDKIATWVSDHQVHLNYSLVHK